MVLAWTGPFIDRLIDRVTLHLYYTVCLARLDVFPLHLGGAKLSYTKLGA